jgi:hypothetical protein
MGTTFAILRASGKTPDDSDSFDRYANIGHNSTLHDFNIDIGKLSWPLLVLFFRFAIMSCISFSKTGLKNIELE